jgi:hypothetical protein
LPYAFPISYHEWFEDQNGFFELVVKEVNPECASTSVVIEKVQAKEEIQALDKENNVVENRGVGGARKSPFGILSEDEIERLKEEIIAIGADISVFRFNKGSQTGYSDKYDVISVRGDVLPDENSTHPRSLMSERAVLAHEYYGHRNHKGTSLPINDWRDEFRASYKAAQKAPNLSDEDRRYLVLDAIERAKEAGVSIRYNNFIRRCLYGY